MVKLGQTKRAVIIELVLILILTLILAYSRVPESVPATTHLPVPPLVTTPVPAPVTSRILSAASGTKSAQVKAKIHPQAAKSTLVAKPVLVPIVATTIQDVPESAPVPVPKEALIPVPESTAAFVAKPAVISPVPEIVPEPAPVPVSKEALVTVTEPTSAPVPKVFPAAELSQAQALPLPPESTTSTSALIAGTAAALILAPIVAPVSIIVGIVVGMFTPTATQLGQSKPVPTKNRKGVSNTGSSSSY